ncbi:MAG: nitroreductase family protein [Solirubrobacterales bacterium]
MDSLTVNPETCTKCGLCAEVCPARAIRHAAKALPAQDPERAAICIECGQCMAVCPSQSIVTGQLRYGQDFIPIAKSRIDYAMLFESLASRRSVRNFQPRPVPRELLEQIIAAIELAPMGFPPHKTHLTVIQERAAVERLLPPMVSFFENMLRWIRNPIMRFFIRRDAGEEQFRTIQNHLIPIMKLRVPTMKQPNALDEITRGAPVLILFHAPISAEGHTADAYIAMTYGLLAAHALGLGATSISLVPPAINKTPQLRDMVQLPPNHEVVTSIILGYPRFKYQRGIRRRLASVHWR